MSGTRGRPLWARQTIRQGGLHVAGNRCARPVGPHASSTPELVPPDQLHFGLLVLIASAMPANKPPPPTGTTTASSRGTCHHFKAHGALPRNDCRIVKAVDVRSPSFGQSSAVCRLQGCSPQRRTFAPNNHTGVASPTRMDGHAHRDRNAQFRPWCAKAAWFPGRRQRPHVVWHLGSASKGRCEARSLNEPVRCRCSSLVNTVQSHRSERAGASKQGV